MARDAQLEVVFTVPVEAGGHEMYIVLTRLRIGMTHFPALQGYGVSEISAIGKFGFAALVLGYKTERASGIRGGRWFVVLRAFRPMRARRDSGKDCLDSRDLAKID